VVAVVAQDRRKNALRCSSGCVASIVGAQIVVIAKHGSTGANTAGGVAAVRVAQTLRDARVGSECAVCNSAAGITHIGSAQVVIIAKNRCSRADTSGGVASLRAAWGIWASICGEFALGFSKNGVRITSVIGASVEIVANDWEGHTATSGGVASLRGAEI